MKNNDIKITIVGLGYVGLPLALAFSKKYNVIAFDKNKNRIKELKIGFDINKETSKKILLNSKIFLTSEIKEIKNSNFYIVAVPTPINSNNKPDLRNLKSACLMISKVLKKNDFVVFESTVYPGLTEEFCVPLLEKNNKLRLNKDYYCGYSPERINPGDKKHGIENIVKITSGSNKYSSNKIDKLYKSIINAGTYKASSIKVAEAAKVIENTQRDLNIAFVNELSIIFDKLNLNTTEVLKAASTKWNFLEFYPGLVGGHCIGVDPYYLTHKSIIKGYKPKFILSGRIINNGMSRFVFDKLIQFFKKNKIKLSKINVLIMGMTFKENCADIRNSQVFDILKRLNKYKINFEIYDPWVGSVDKYNKKLIKKLNKDNYYDAVIITVAHKKFIDIGYKKIQKILKKKSLLFDLKNIFKLNNSDNYKSL